MQNKVFKNAYYVLASILFCMLIGTAGAFDYNTISLTQTIIQGSLLLSAAVIKCTKVAIKKCTDMASRES